MGEEMSKLPALIENKSLSWREIEEFRKNCLEFLEASKKLEALDTNICTKKEAINFIAFYIDSQDLEGDYIFQPGYWELTKLRPGNDTVILEFHYTSLLISLCLYEIYSKLKGIDEAHNEKLSNSIGKGISFSLFIERDVPSAALASTLGVDFFPMIEAMLSCSLLDDFEHKGTFPIAHGRDITTLISAQISLASNNKLFQNGWGESNISLKFLLLVLAAKAGHTTWSEERRVLTDKMLHLEGVPMQDFVPMSNCFIGGIYKISLQNWGKQRWFIESKDHPEISFGPYDSFRKLWDEGWAFMA